ncbi:MAG: hypothetical protein WBA44_00710 [Mesorhizobium sp.]
MWFTIAALFAGASGTYFIAPAVNAQFEAQRIRTDFVIRNYNDLRMKMEDFQGLLQTTFQRFVGGDDVLADVMKLQDLAARVGAQNLAMMPMFKTSDGPQAAAAVTAAVNGALNVMFENAGKSFETAEAHTEITRQFQASNANLARALLALYVSIGEIGNLDPTSLDVDLQPGASN